MIFLKILIIISRLMNSELTFSSVLKMRRTGGLRVMQYADLINSRKKVKFQKVPNWLPLLAFGSIKL